MTQQKKRTGGALDKTGTEFTKLKEGLRLRDVKQYICIPLGFIIGVSFTGTFLQVYLN